MIRQRQDHTMVRSEMREQRSEIWSLFEHLILILILRIHCGGLLQKVIFTQQDKDEDKTDPNGFVWSGKRDSNSRPSPWQGDALPTELFPQTLHFTAARKHLIALPTPKGPLWG